MQLLINISSMCWILILFSLISCSGLEQGEQEKLRRLNAQGECIYRNHDEFLYPDIENPKQKPRGEYPWEVSKK